MVVWQARKDTIVTRVNLAVQGNCKMEELVQYYRRPEVLERLGLGTLVVEAMVFE